MFGILTNLKSRVVCCGSILAIFDSNKCSADIGSNLHWTQYYWVRVSKIQISNMSSLQFAVVQSEIIRCYGAMTCSCVHKHTYCENCDNLKQRQRASLCTAHPRRWKQIRRKKLWHVLSNTHLCILHFLKSILLRPQVSKLNVKNSKASKRFMRCPWNLRDINHLTNYSWARL